MQQSECQDLHRRVITACELTAKKAVLTNVQVRGTLTNQDGKVVTLGGPSWQMLASGVSGGSPGPLIIGQGHPVRFSSNSMHLATHGISLPSGAPGLQLESANLSGFGPPVAPGVGNGDTYLDLATGDVHVYTQTASTVPLSWTPRGNIAASRATIPTYAQRGIGNGTVILTRPGLDITLRSYPNPVVAGATILGWFIRNNTGASYAVNIDQTYTIGNGSSAYTNLNYTLAVSNTWVQVSSPTADLERSGSPQRAGKVTIKIFPIQGQLSTPTYDISCVTLNGLAFVYTVEYPQVSA